MKNVFKKIGISILGLLQGTVGSYIAILGWACAFPGTESGSKDYEEDMLFVPFGYAIMLIWIAVMIIAFIKLRKDKGKLLLFLVPWLIGVCIFIFSTVYLLKRSGY